MIQILKPNGLYMNMLGRPKQITTTARLLTYCVTEETEDGYLLFNGLTRELLLLTKEEYDQVLELDYLRSHWFVVPQELDDFQAAKGVVWFSRTMKTKSEHLTAYTILPTTDCNARCFYCFELGRAHTHMSDEVAVKTAGYIKDHCGGNKVLLHWFGGEPLYNHRAIDLICEELRRCGIEYESEMVSNAYLFDDEMVSKAVNLWNMKKVQVTLDGTEEVYNKCKAYIYKVESAYQVVMSNIQRLLDQNIRIQLRMNLDFHNIADLKELTVELGRRFGTYRGFYAYPSLIIDTAVPWQQRYTMEQWNELYTAMEQINDQLKEAGIYGFRGERIKNTLPQTHCMADCDAAVVIMPTGQLCCCENYADDEMFGHIDQQERNQQIIDSWRMRDDEISECATCFYYPDCVRLKKCPSQVSCNVFEREFLLRKTKDAMCNEYRRWLKKQNEPSGDA